MSDYGDHQILPPDSNQNVLEKRRDSHRRVEQELQESQYDSGINNYFGSD